MEKIKVAVLGSTGSVGTQALDSVRGKDFEVVLLSAGNNAELLAKQIGEFSPKTVTVETKEAAEKLKALISDNVTVLWEKKAILDAIRTTEADVIIHSVAGLAGIDYALAAADSGKRIGMANKEAIISLGDVIYDHLKASGGVLIPVDSEHSAIFQCLQNESAPVKRILLTASGGPFYGYTTDMLREVTVEKALAHPTWKMGPKITVDSATLMNKGFEIMEAVRLFGVPESKVEVLVHRQSIIHSMVEFCDNTTKAILSEPDMRHCIRYALTYPDRMALEEPSLDYAKLGTLTFSKPDTETFPLLTEARKAINKGGSAPLSLIAADEAAVDAFFKKRIGFTDISLIVAEIMEKIDIIYDVDEYNVTEIANAVKVISNEYIQNHIKGV